MPPHLQRDIEKLKKNILGLSASVEESVRDALDAFERKDRELAGKVIDGDAEIDRKEIEVEEDCLKILALHQPVAIDLRFIVSVLKIHNDLERIGDLAVNIAEQTVLRRPGPGAETPDDMDDMAARARSMLRSSLDALVNLDEKAARGVFAADDAVDALLDKMYGHVKAHVTADPGTMDSMMRMLLVARHLERIADLATNIAEDVVYMIEGKIVRHGSD